MLAPTFSTAQAVVDFRETRGCGTSLSLITDLTVEPPRVYVLCCEEIFALGIDDLQPLYDGGYFGPPERSFLRERGMVH